MKKNTLKGIIAALVVTSGIGAGAIAYNAGHNTASETAAIEKSIAEEALYSRTKDEIIKQLTKTERVTNYLASVEKQEARKKAEAEKAAADKAAAEKKAAEEKAAAEKVAAEKKAAEEKAAADKAAAEKKAADEQAAREQAAKEREEAEKARKQKEEEAKKQEEEVKKAQKERAEKIAAKKQEIMNAVKTAKEKSEDGTISKEDQDSIKALVKEAADMGVTFTAKDVKEMKLSLKELADLDLEVEFNATDKDSAALSYKLDIRKAIVKDLADSADGRMSQNGIDGVKNILSDAAAREITVSFTANEISSMNICNEDVVLMGLQING